MAAGALLNRRCLVESQGAWSKKRRYLVKKQVLGAWLNHGCLVESHGAFLTKH